MKEWKASSALVVCVLVQSACSSGGALPQTAPPAAAREAADAVVAGVPDLGRLGLRDAGAASAGTNVRIAVTLRYRNQTQLDRLVASQAALGSPQYRAWLTDAQFEERFGPSRTAYSAVIGSLRRAGFKVSTTYENRTVVDASASVAVAQRYFRTSIHNVTGGARGPAYVNVKPAYAPSDVAGYILSVDGLNTIDFLQTAHETIGQSRASGAFLNAKTSNAKLFGPVSKVTGARGYSPIAFSAGYDLPIEHKGPDGNYDGSGRASGVVIDADFAESDLRQYLAYFGIARKGPATKRVLIDGGPSKPGDGAADSIEAVLDVEALIGDAPGTALSMYEIPNLDNASVTDAFNKVVSDDAVDTLNSSFGGCEELLGASTAKAWGALAEQGASKGITFHASTGDSGGSLCANIPAALPYVAAIGGTALELGGGGAWVSEVAWSGSGGGVSSLFARPAWQSGVSGTNNLGRNVPDFALDADPYTGIAYYYAGTWDTSDNPLGGTSLSSPMFGAAITEIDQVMKGRIGLADGAFYGAFHKYGYGTGASAYFHDIVQGNNGAFYTSSGYDLVTGIGSVDFWNLSQKL